MGLPLPWVDKIFAKLTLTYGRDFIGRWEGIELADVKTDWAHELGGYESNPDAIAFALRNLPAGKPPTVLEFKAICLKSPRNDLALPAPQADYKVVAKELAKMLPMKNKVISTAVDPKAWAKSILSRVNAGQKLNPTTVRFAKEALREV